MLAGGNLEADPSLSRGFMASVRGTSSHKGPPHLPTHGALAHLLTAAAYEIGGSGETEARSTNFTKGEAETQRLSASSPVSLVRSQVSGNACRAPFLPAIPGPAVGTPAHPRYGAQPGLPWVPPLLAVLTVGPPSPIFADAVSQL